MTKLSALPLLLLIGSSTAVRAAIGVVESTGEFNVNSTTVYYSPIAGGGGSGNPDLPTDLGTFDVSAGDTLSITNWFFENYAYNSGGGDTQFENNWLDGAKTATLHISMNGNPLTSVGLSQTETNDNNRKWAANPSNPIDLLAGLSNGSHSLEVSVDYTYNWWDGSQTNIGTSLANGLSSASFTVVPEPSSALLISLGSLLLFRRSRQ